MRSLICIFLGLLWTSVLSAQASPWLICFSSRDAQPASFDPSSLLDERCISRRLKAGLPLLSADDLPPDAEKVSAVTDIAPCVRHVLHWFNAISVEADGEQLASIRQLPFVAQVIPLGETLNLQPASVSSSRTDPEYVSRVHRLVRKQLHLDTLSALGLDGSGVRIAILDVGFKGADTHPGLQHVFAQHHIIATRDFYSGGDQVYHHAQHGTNVLSCIAGKYNGVLIGAAPSAEFLLARTEHNYFEKRVEEDHWMAAAEWAERNGADILSSSLGYTRRYNFSMLDGKSTLVSRAAAIAVSKGVLVVNCAGNDGSGKFTYINAPADVDSVLTVGGTYPMVAVHIPFSSYGPNANGTMKPDVCAPALSVVATAEGSYKAEYGTSFSTPLISGVAACMMQKHPEWTSAQVFRALRESGSLYPYYDYAHGFGVPDPARWESHASRDIEFPFRSISESHDTLFFWFRPDVLTRDTADNSSGRPLYYHIRDDEGNLTGYNCAFISPGTVSWFFPPEMRRNGTLSVWFEGYLWTDEKSKE